MIGYWALQRPRPVVGSSTWPRLLGGHDINRAAASASRQKMKIA